MKSGKYIVSHRMLGGKYTAKVSKGYANIDGLILTAPKFTEHYKIVKQVETKYNLHYYANGRLIETIKLNGSYPLAKSKQSELQRQSKLGKYIIVQTV